MTLTTCGCNGAGGGSAGAVDVQHSHVYYLVQLYVHALRDQGRPPQSEDEFKQYIAKQDSAMLERMNVATADELFVSERDGKPIVVLYGKRRGPAAEVVAYEAEGVDGTRLVAKATGQVQVMSAEEFAATGLK